MSTESTFVHHGHTWAYGEEGVPTPALGENWVFLHQGGHISKSVPPDTFL